MKKWFSIIMAVCYGYDMLFSAALLLMIRMKIQKIKQKKVILQIL